MAIIEHKQKTSQNSWKSEIKKKKKSQFFFGGAGIFDFKYHEMAGNSHYWGLKLNHQIEGITNCEIMKCGDPLYLNEDHKILHPLRAIIPYLSLLCISLKIWFDNGVYTHNEGLINKSTPKLATAKYFGYWGSLSEYNLSPYIALLNQDGKVKITQTNTYYLSS